MKGSTAFSPVEVLTKSCTSPRLRGTTARAGCTKTGTCGGSRGTGSAAADLRQCGLPQCVSVPDRLRTYVRIAGQTFQELAVFAGCRHARRDQQADTRQATTTPARGRGHRGRHAAAAQIVQVVAGEGSRHVVGHPAILAAIDQFPRPDPTEGTRLPYTRRVQKGSGRQPVPPRRSRTRHWPG